MPNTSKATASAPPRPRRERDESTRFYCPYPGCQRSFAELWRLKVHYRAPPDVRGSGKERGHGQELQFCPRCHKELKAGKHHVGCFAGRSAPRQAAKRFRMSQSGAGATTVTTPAGPSTVVGGWAPPGALDAAAAHAAALHAHAAAAAAAHAGGVHLGAPPPDALYAGAGFMDDLLGGVPLVPPHGNGGAHAPPPPPPPFGDRAPSPPPLPPGEDGRPMHLLFDFDLFTASHGGGAPPPPPPAASPPAVRASSAGDGGKPVHTVMSNATSSGGGLGPADAAAAAAAATGPCGGLGGGGMEDDGDDYIMQIMFGEPAAAVPRRVTAHLHTWESAEWHGGGGGGGGNGNGTASGDASPRDADRGPRHHAVHGVASPRGSLDALLGISGGGEARVSLHRLVPLSAATVAPPPPGAPGVPPAAAAAPPRPPPPQMAAAVGAGGLPDAAVLGWATPAVPPAATG